MPSVLAVLGQGLVYGLIALVLGYFSVNPAYQRFSSDAAQVILSFSHTGQRKEKCRKPTREEIEATAANMRRPEICQRERLPVAVELRLSDKLLYSEIVRPAGLSRDGASRVYKRLMIAPGHYRLAVRLRDGPEDSGFNYEGATNIDLAPGENYVIDFRSEMGGFLFSRAGAKPVPAAGDQKP